MIRAFGRSGFIPDIGRSAAAKAMVDKKARPAPDNTRSRIFLLALH